MALAFYLSQKQSKYTLWLIITIITTIEIILFLSAINLTVHKNAKLKNINKIIIIT